MSHRTLVLSPLAGSRSRVLPGPPSQATEVRADSAHEGAWSAFRHELGRFGAKPDPENTPEAFYGALSSHPPAEK